MSRALLLRAPALRAPALRAGRRTVVLAAAVSAGVLLIVGLAAGWASGGHSNVTYVDGSDSAVLYAAGHRPLAPDFSGTTLTGSRLSFSSYRGNVVVLNFWGSWCVPCREEASTLASVAALYRSSGVQPHKPQVDRGNSGWRNCSPTIYHAPSSAGEYPWTPPNSRPRSRARR